MYHQTHPTSLIGSLKRKRSRGTFRQAQNKLEPRRDFADAQPADLIRNLPEAQKKQVMVDPQPLPAFLFLVRPAGFESSKGGFRYAQPAAYGFEDQES